MNTVKFVKIREDAQIPVKGTEDSAGFDLIALDTVVIPAQTTVVIKLGFLTEIPKHLHARIESRSGMACKGLVVQTGVIDADYRGEWGVILRNHNAGACRIEAGSRIAQVVFRETPPVVFELSESLSETSRGAGGFGSTGS
jgi:dUTP pyrophosphatase